MLPRMNPESCEEESRRHTGLPIPSAFFCGMHENLNPNLTLLFQTYLKIPTSFLSPRLLRPGTSRLFLNPAALLLHLARPWQFLQFLLHKHRIQARLILTALCIPLQRHPLLIPPIRVRTALSL